MNLINKSGSETQEPYQPGVYMLTGVNGIGKSTVVDALTSNHPEAVPLHASQELSELFNGISREEMELLAPEEKLGKMVIHFTTIFDRVLNSDKAVILDTHLLVPIRKNNELVYEDIWSDQYSPYVSSMAMLAANPDSVRAWRLSDEKTTGRKRNTKTDDIILDQEANLARFTELRASGVLSTHSGVVENVENRLTDTQAAIESIFKNTQ
jgi:adenylate kinase